MHCEFCWGYVKEPVCAGSLVFCSVECRNLYLQKKAKRPLKEIKLGTKHKTITPDMVNNFL